MVTKTIKYRKKSKKHFKKKSKRYLTKKSKTYLTKKSKKHLKKIKTKKIKNFSGMGRRSSRIIKPRIRFDDDDQYDYYYAQDPPRPPPDAAVPYNFDNFSHPPPDAAVPYHHNNFTQPSYYFSPPFELGSPHDPNYAVVIDAIPRRNPNSKNSFAKKRRYDKNPQLTADVVQNFKKRDRFPPRSSYQKRNVFITE